MSGSTISSPNYADRGHFGTTSGVHSLPSEILERIFRLVYDMNLHRVEPMLPNIIVQLMDNDFPSQSSEKTWPVLADEVMAHPSLFPYSISYVCSAWNRVCLRIPEFWTRIFIDIGPQASSVLQLQKELEASHNLAITVHVSRRDGHESPDPLEHRRMKAFMKVLSSHISRFRGIRVKTTHSSSLGYLREYLFGSAPVLKKLYACCHYHDPQTEITLPRNEGISSDLCAYQIEEIILDPYFFQSHSLQQWITGIAPSALQYMAVLHLSESKTENRIQLPLCDTLRMLRHMSTGMLQSLGFKGVDFDSEALLNALSFVHPSQAPELDPIVNWPKYIFFQDLQPLAVSAILNLVRPTFINGIVITNCPVSNIDPTRFPSTWVLTLEDESDNEDLGPILRGSCVHALTVINCPSFNSRTIDEMSPGSNVALWSAPMLSQLRITGTGVCDQAFMESLKKLIATRRLPRKLFFHRTETGKNIPPCFSSIDTLHLKSIGPVDDADFEWLRENVRRLDIEGRPPVFTNINGSDPEEDEEEEDDDDDDEEEEEGEEEEEEEEEEPLAELL